MNDWNIQTRARTCQGCGSSFGDRDPYHTVLFEQRSGLERLDVCAACWDGQHRHGAADRKGFISHWQGSFPAPAPTTPDPIQRDSAESLLRELLDRNEPKWQPAAFILATMLERKRILKVREQIRKNGRRTIVYEMPRTGDLFLVVDPDLQLDQLSEVQQDVSRLLEQGLPSQGTPTEEPFIPETPASPLSSTQDLDASATPAVPSESPSPLTG